MLKLDFKGKVVLIIGGGSGIGRATALAFSQANAKVIIAGRDRNKLSETIDMMEQNHGDGVFYQVDVRDRKSMEDFFEKLELKHPQVDIAINCAGAVTQLTSLEQITETDFDQIMSTNVKGAWLSMKYELIQMKKQRNGVIVNISSINGFSGTPNASIYAASKAALNSLTKTAALESAAHGIRIYSLCPGPVQAPLLEEVFRQTGLTNKEYESVIPQGRIGSANEIANTALWLCSDLSSYMTGQVIAVDGGLSAKG